MKTVLKSLLLAFLAVNASYAQPIPPSLSNPVKLTQGGNELSGAATVISTSGTFTAQALSTGKLIYTNSGTIALHGIVSDAKAKTVIVFNQSSSNFTIVNNSVSSASNDRITTPNSTTFTLRALSGVELFYDTNSSRWRFARDIFTVQSPLVISASGVISIPQASGSTSGYLSAADYATFLAGTKWSNAGTGNDIYNTNSESVLLVRYDCADLTTYATCQPQVASGCVMTSANSCNDFDGDQSSCEAEPQCSWSDPICDGNYFSACSGIYRQDDTSGAKLQVNSATQCFGTAASCASLGYGSNCSDQDGCTNIENSCPDYPSDETGCVGAGCSFTPESDCGAIGPTSQSACEDQGGGGICAATMGGDCADWNADEGACLTYAPDCTWDGIDTCSGTYITGCSGTLPSTCTGNNSYCAGTATACASIVGSSNCTDQDGCTFGVAPAARLQGDTIVTDDGYLQAEKTSAGAPTSGDCDASGELGRFVTDTTNNRLYFCNGATRLWDYMPLFPASGSAYSATNVTTDRAIDADATTVNELADVLGTLIQDLQTKGVLE